MASGSARILVAEDSPTQAAQLRLVLEEAGYTVEIASDGERAMQMARTAAYDLLVSDVMMPGLSGFDLCRLLRANPATWGIPVLLVTTIDDPKEIMRGLEAGADGYIAKPWQPEQLVGRIEALLRAPAREMARAERAEDTSDVIVGGRRVRVRASRESALQYLVSIVEQFSAQRRVGTMAEESARSGEPDADGNQQATSSSTAPAPARRREGPASILVVEDSKTQAMKLKVFLESCGWLVEIATSGAAAAERLRAATYDLVLSDVMMPDVSGYELCLAIKADPKTAATRVILITGLDSPTEVIRGLECGADNFVVKPFDEGQLRTRIEDALSSSGGASPLQAEEGNAAEVRFGAGTYKIASNKTQVLNYLVAAFEDILITKEKLKEVELTRRSTEESRIFLESALEALSAFVAVLDEDGVILATNRAWQGFAELNPLVANLRPGENYLDYLNVLAESGDEKAGATWQGIRDVAAGRRDLFRLEYPSHTAVEQRWFTLRATCFHDSSRRVVLAHENSTALRLQEIALAESEQKYRELFERAAFGMYRSTIGGRFLAVNPELVRMLGYGSEQEMLALDMARDVYTGPEARRRSMEHAQSLSVADEIRGSEVTWKRKDGSLITVLLNGRQVRGADGAISLYEMSVEDVTERRQLEAQLRQAQKMEAVGQLTGGIAHDFNNILSIILSNAEFLHEALPPDRADLASDIEQVQQAARRGTKLVKQLMGFSRSQELSLEVRSLPDLLEHAVGLMRQLLPESIEVRFHQASGTRWVRVDSGALEQILLNLGTNARDAMPNGGAIDVRLLNASFDAAACASRPGLAPGDYHCIAISDTGTGIPAEILGKILEPFFTTKAPGAGTGLGMSMIYGLMKQHQGYLDVESEVGRGTTVTLMFPAVAAPLEREDAPAPAIAESAAAAASVVDAVSAAPASAPASTGGRTATILLVEDEAPLRRVATRILEKAGHTVLVAENGERALEIVRTRADEIALVVSDMVMPKMGGMELMETLRRQGNAARFLFTSGYSARDMAAPRGPASDVPVLQKPYTVEQLLGTVRELLEGGPA